MAEYLIQLESRAHPGQDEEYHRWYDAVHLPDVLNVPGFKSAKRYNVIDPTNERSHYMAIYSVECDDPHALLGRLFEAAKEMELSPALDTTHVKVTVLQPR